MKPNFILRLITALVVTAVAINSYADQNQADAADEFTYQNYADDFLRLWNTTQKLPAWQRRNAFKQKVSALYPEFYGAARYATDHYGNPSTAEIAAFLDKKIDSALATFPEIKESYILKLSAFDKNINRNLDSFRLTFPGFELTTPVYLLHSLGEMDGGTRELNGQSPLIFGLDGMVRFHDFEDESAFFYHELFHVYHEKFLGSCDAIWCSAWREGLAIFVAQHLNPTASDSELLLNFPEGMADAVRSRLLENLDHLAEVYQSHDKKIYQALFQTSADSTGLPPRRGYYLGYLIAQEASQQHQLTALAQMSAKQAMIAFEAALKRVRLAAK